MTVFSFDVTADGIRRKTHDGDMLMQDLWLRRGVVNFTTFLAERGVAFHADWHMLRLKAGCEEAGILFPKHAMEALRAELPHMIQRVCPGGRAQIEVMVTPGCSDDNWTPKGPQHIYVIIHALSSDRPTVSFVRLGTVAYHRPTPIVKDRNYRVAWSAYQRAKGSGDMVDDILYIENEEVSECSRSNIFFVKDGILMTPPDTVALSGITRKIVMDLARAEGYEVRSDDPIMLKMAYTADEAFTTGSIAGIRPVASIDGHHIGSAPPGPLTEKLMALYDAYKREYIKNALHA